MLQLSEVGEDNHKFRLDAEFFSRGAMSAYGALRAHRRFRDLVAQGYRVIYENTRIIPREEGVAEGLPFFLQAADIETPFVRADGMGCVAKTDWDRYPKGRIVPGEVLIEVKGLAEKVALVTSDVPGNTLVTGTCYKMRTHDSLDARLLIAFLASRHGQALKNRLKSNLIVSFISKEDLFGMPVPDFGGDLKKQIAQAIDGAYVLHRQSSHKLRDAEGFLISALGLADWHPSEPLTYTRRVSEAFAARRLDSRYFTPRVAELLSRLGVGGQCLRDAAPQRRERFIPSASGNFRYMEISDIGSGGNATTNDVPMRDAPSRATWYVRGGDVVTSTVRPNRRLSALVEPEQDGCVASSGLVVFKPRTVPAEVLLTYLRLPVFCELMDLHTSASLYPAISEGDLLALPFPEIAAATSDSIVSAVRLAHAARKGADDLLTQATRGVEIAIEDSEAAALQYLEEV